MISINIINCWSPCEVAVKENKYLIVCRSIYFTFNVGTDSCISIVDSVDIETEIWIAVWVDLELPLCYRAIKNHHCILHDMVILPNILCTYQLGLKFASKLQIYTKYLWNVTLQPKYINNEHELDNGKNTKLQNEPFSFDFSLLGFVPLSTIQWMNCI
jgi:hypothetical protein